MNSKILFVFLFFAFVQQSNAQCDPGEFKVTIEIDPDASDFTSIWVGVASHDFSAFLVTQFLTADEFTRFEFCIPATERCAEAFVSDISGNGMGDQGDGDHGWFKIYINDVLVLDNPTGEFTFTQSVTFNCPEGALCSNALVAQLGNDTIPDGVETWYEFMAPQTGTYQFDACDPENSCRVKFWLYGFCQNLHITDNQAGALFYSDGNCPLGTKATIYLEGGRTYYMRTKYRYEGCVGHPLMFNLNFQGPVKGCTDPAACNYQPLATISDTCIYDGIECAQLPDLETDEGLLRHTFGFSYLYNSSDCTVNEGCLRGYGKRDIIRFSTRISNVGDEDYYIGETPLSPDTPSDQFVYDPCHLHWHYRGYAEYLLYKSDGTQVPIGSKNGFCVLDLECNNGGFGKYTCENMGISAGCSDIYDSYLDCQWIDITDLPAGAYTFVMRVNWDKSPDKNGRLEKSYTNNWAQACFVLSYDQNNQPLVEMVDECPTFVDCQGELFGNAQPDCEGNCNGQALRGDFNKDHVRNTADVDAYLDASLDNNTAVTPCNDMNADGRIHLYDAALLQECVLHENDPQHWGSRIPCNFPGGLNNPADHMSLSLGVFNKTNKTLDIRIFNPSYQTFGLQFNVEGLRIESIEKLNPNSTIEIRFNAATGEIVLLSRDESGINTHSSSTSFLRIHYSELIAAKVCLASLTVAVNEEYQSSNGVISAPSCYNTGITAVEEPKRAGYDLTAMPNPFSAGTDIYFDNESQAPISMTLLDMNGKVLRNFENVRTEHITIERNELPQGMYIACIRGDKGSSYIKLAIQDKH